MTEFTHARLAELKAVAEAAFPVEDWAIWKDLKEGGFIHVGNARGVIPEGEIATPEDAEPNPVAKAYTPELGRHIATFDPPTTLALIAALEAETAEVEGYKQRFPCDGGCSYNDGPQEECSLHGRNPSELWEVIGGLARERDEARAYADNHVLDADATYVRMAEKLEQVKRECDAAQLVMNAHSCGENVEAAYRRTIEAEQERDEARAEVERLREIGKGLVKERRAAIEELDAICDAASDQHHEMILAIKRADRAEAALERVREAATEVVNQEDNHGRTHYENCWQHHLHCLAAKIIYETGEDDD